MFDYLLTNTQIWKRLIKASNIYIYIYKDMYTYIYICIYIYIYIYICIKVNNGDSVNVARLCIIALSLKALDHIMSNSKFLKAR